MSKYYDHDYLQNFSFLFFMSLLTAPVKGLRTIKIVKEIKFEEVWSKIEAKKFSQKQLLTRYLRQTLVFM